jgi:hypothetical protein
LKSHEHAGAGFVLPDGRTIRNQKKRPMVPREHIGTIFICSLWKYFHDEAAEERL